MRRLGLFKRWFAPQTADPEAKGRTIDKPPPPPPQPVVAPVEKPSEELSWWVPRGHAVLRPPAPAYTPDETVLVGPDGTAQCNRELAEILARTLQDPNLELPPLPKVGQRVLALLTVPDADFAQIARLVSEDEVLAAEVLRMVNSPVYRGSIAIRRLDLAFARLGQRALRALMLRVTVKTVTNRCTGPYRALGQELWGCSLGSGVIVGLLCAAYSLAEEDAFLVGLLHDIGMVAVMKVMADYHRKTSREVPRPMFDVLATQWHEQVGRRIASAWNLPSPLPDIIGDHHRSPAPDDPLKQYRYLVQVADVICAMIGYAPHVPYDFFKLACVKALGLKDDEPTRSRLTDLPKILKQRMDSL